MGFISVLLLKVSEFDGYSTPIEKSYEITTVPLKWTNRSLK